jgi:serine/threonine protein kinase/Tol biopolymer transport system component
VLSEASPAHLAGFQAGSLLAGYRLEAQVGEGGMAVVFRARDQRLGRLVALKILAPALALDSAFRSRFIAESRAAAAVDDPYIIPVYEADEADGVLFIAMRFVQGGDLRQVLEREGALPPDRVVGFISPVASALDAAHRAGLVHRDVKPANILVDAREDRPDHVYLSDFGVSKAMSSVGLTGTGMFVGTPDYSAPEQIQGRAVDGRTDQYALGCVTYQLLAGALPFQGEQDMSVLLAHLSAPPPSLVSRMPDLPGAVDQVLARAMAKAPEKRYASCLDFADALREALGLTPYDPQSSAIASAVPQPATSPHEIPTLAAAETAIAATGTTADTPVIPMADQLGLADPGPGSDRARPAPPPPRRGFVDRPRTITARIRRRRLPALVLACAILAAAGVIPFVLTSPAKSPGPAHPPSPANSPNPAHSPSYSRAGIDLPSPYAGNSVSSLAFSPSGATLAIADIYICLWDIAATGCTTASVFTDENSVAFSPDGKTLAAGAVTGRTYLWNVVTGKPAATLTDPSSKGVESVAFSPDGKTLAAGDFNGRTYLWNVATAKPAATLTDPSSKGVESVAFSPDGKTLAAGDFNGSTYLWNVATGKLAATPTDSRSQGVGSVAFSPDGKTLAAGDFNGSTDLWNLATGKLAATLIDPGSRGVDSVAFSPDGKTLAAGDGNGSTDLWNLATGKLAATLTDPRSLAVNSVAFGPNGKTLATGDGSGGVYLWHIS